MIVIGAILAVIGWLVGISILLWIGVALLLIGAILALVGGPMGHPVAGRRHYF